MILVAISSTITVARTITAMITARAMLEVRFCRLIMAAWATASASAAFCPASAAVFSLGVQLVTISEDASCRSVRTTSAIC